MAKFMALLPLTSSPEYKSLQDQVRKHHHLLTPHSSLHLPPHLPPQSTLRLSRFRS